MDWIPNPMQRLVLPQLGGSEDELPPASNFTATRIHPAIRAKLLDTIRTPLERGHWQPASIENFPSCPKLEHCIDMYFVHFNTVRHEPWTINESLISSQQFLSIIHRPTFDPLKDLLLTLTVVCVGSGFTALEKSREFSNTLSEICRRLLLLSVSC
jgi:hypothetical protein